jgi:hypothetical protein
MLLDRATGLADKITHYQNLKAAARQADLYRTRADQFGQVRASLAEARVALERFHTSGIPVEFVALNADMLGDKASTLRAMVTADPTVLADPPFNLKFEFTDRLLGITESAKDAIERAWVAYVAVHGPTGSSEVLDALAKLPQFQASVARIRRCRQSAEDLAKRTPSDPEKAIESLKAWDAEYRAAWSELNADGIPRTVILFLRACADNGVPLSELTDEVHGWLEARALLSSFRVRIG